MAENMDNLPLEDDIDRLVLGEARGEIAQLQSQPAERDAALTLINKQTCSLMERIKVLEKLVGDAIHAINNDYRLGQRWRNNAVATLKAKAALVAHGIDTKPVVAHEMGKGESQTEVALPVKPDKEK